MKIATLTLNPALDKSASVDRFTPEKKLRCTNPRIDAGGGGINVSKGIKKLGGNSIAVFPSGGYNGAILKSKLDESGIAVDCVEIQGETRENFSITEESTEAQYRFTMPGVEVTEKEAERCLDKLKAIQPDLIVASGSLPPGLPESYYHEVALFCKKINAKLVLDTSGKALETAAREGMYLLKPNLGELSALVGVEKLEMNKVDDAAMEIVKRGNCEVVVVSMGAQGALLANKDGFEHFPAPLVHKQTTVGAGDSMVAGLVWSLSENKTLREMARIGVACGSAATMSKGTELFDVKDVWPLVEWIENYGDRYRFTDF